MLFLMDAQVGDLVLSSGWLPECCLFPKPRMEAQEAFNHSEWLENLGDGPSVHARGRSSVG